MNDVAWGTVVNFSIVLIALFVLVYISRHYSGIFTLEAPMTPRETELLHKIAELEQQVEVLWDLLTKANGQVLELRRLLEDKKVIEKTLTSTLQVVILAIWPNSGPLPKLNLAAESDALYNAGYHYIALRGDRANRAGVILEIDRVRPTIIQIGGHGDYKGIWLSDGIAEPGWWSDAIRGRNISLMVLLSCDSSQQDRLNISDVLLRAGVGAVISCDESIADTDAIKFAELLYAYLSSGSNVATATERAKLGLPRASAEMIRLRENRK